MQAVDFSDVKQTIETLVKEATMPMNKKIENLGDLIGLKSLPTSTPLVFTDCDGYISRIFHIQTGYFDPDVEKIVYEKDTNGVKPEGLKKCLIFSPYEE
jgi:hypothetical protein